LGLVTRFLGSNPIGFALCNLKLRCCLFLIDDLLNILNAFPSGPTTLSRICISAVTFLVAEEYLTNYTVYVIATSQCFQLFQPPFWDLDEVNVRIVVCIFFDSWYRKLLMAMANAGKAGRIYQYSFV
jgi:hypothetical protein